jgi:hypothetical protein
MRGAIVKAADGSGTAIASMVACRSCEGVLPDGVASSRTGGMYSPAGGWAWDSGVEGARGSLRGRTVVRESFAWRVGEAGVFDSAFSK